MSLAKSGLGLLVCFFFLVILDSFTSVVNKSVTCLGCSMFFGVTVLLFFNKESWITTLVLLVFVSQTFHSAKGHLVLSHSQHLTPRFPIVPLPTLLFGSLVTVSGC